MERNGREGSLPRRRDVPSEYRWRDDHVFASKEEWEAAIESCREAIPTLATYQGRLADGPATLVELFELADRIFTLADSVHLYARLCYESETTNAEAQAMLDVANHVHAASRTAAAFIQPELGGIGLDTVRAWIEQEPRLTHLRHYLERMAHRQERLKSPEAEALLADMNEPFRVARRTLAVLAHSDFRFAPATNSEGRAVAVDNANAAMLMRDADRELRRTTWLSVTDAWLGSKHTLAQCVATIAHQDVFAARARGHESALEAALSLERIDPSVYHTVIDQFRANVDVWHRYFRLRRVALGYDELHTYDLDAPLPDAGVDVPYRDAVEMICRAVRPLGAEYEGTLRAGVERGGWVDIYPNLGKHSGAQMLAAYGVDHPFVLLNHSNDMISASYLAHELGHAMHSLLAHRAQPYVYSGQATFVAETASNVHQALLRHHLLETHSDRTLRLAVLEEALTAFRRYLLRMPILAATELRAREQVERGEPISVELLTAWTNELQAEAYGTEVVLDEDRDGIEWATSPPLLMGGFYAFQYATGIAAAYALLNGILNSRPAVDRYLRMLAAGTSGYAPDLLCSAGPDLSTAAPLQRAYACVSQVVDELEELLIGRSAR